MTSVLFAVSDVAQEAALLAAAPECGIRVARRCVDAVDVLATAIADPTSAVVVSAGLPRLSRDAVDRMTTPHRRVVGLADDEACALALRALGIVDVVAVGATPQATWRAVGLAVSSAESDVDPHEPALEGSNCPRAPGRIVTVWGPAGAPGRTTIALGLAHALSERGLTTALVDADTYGPSVAMALGVVDDASGVVVACRHAERGSLAAASLRSITRPLRPTLHVLTGLSTSSRWPDIRAAALDELWATCREAFDVTVVDVGFCLEEDADEASAWSRRRNATAVTAVAHADEVIAVGGATPMGAARLVDAWPRLTDLTARAEPVVVANRVGGGRQARQWAAAVRELGVGADVHAVPDDPESVRHSWSRGLAPGEGRRRSALRRSVHGLADLVVSG